MNKFFIDDWKRKAFGYETCFEGEEYHLVRKKNSPGLEVVPNSRGYREFNTDSLNGKPFAHFTGRND